VSLVDVIESKDIEQMRQALLGALDRLKEIVSELRDETEIEIRITLKKKGNSNGNPQP
jgi:tRNA-dihydrouridine synthase